MLISLTNRPLGYERVYLPLHKVADTPFDIQWDEMFFFEGQTEKLKTGIDAISTLTLTPLK